MGILKLFNFANLSIVKKIYVLIAVAFIPISFSTFGSLAFMYNIGEVGNIQMLEELTNSVAKNLDNFIDDKKYNLEEISKNEQVVNLLSAQDKDTLKSSATAALKQIQNYISSRDSKNVLFVINTKGECLTFCKVLSQNKNIKDIKNHQIFKEALKGKTYVSPLIDPKTQTELLISHPVKSKKGEIIGVLILKLDEKYIWDEFSKLLDAVEKNQVFLIDNDNTMFNQSKNGNNPFLPPIQLVPNNKNQVSPQNTKNTSRDIKQLLTLPEFAQQVIYRKQESFSQKYNQRMYFSSILPKQGWIIGVIVPEFEVLGYLRFVIIANTIIVVMIGGITIAIAIHLANSISQPIRILIKTAKAIERGDFEQVAQIANYVKIRVNDNLTTKAEKLTKSDSNILIKTSERRDDLGQLMRVFMQMASHVKEREQNLQKQVEKLHIKIDMQKKMRDVKNLTENEKFENLRSTVNTLKKRRNKS